MLESNIDIFVKNFTLEGYSLYLGTAESAHWYLTNEIGTLRKCLEKYYVFNV